MIVAVNSHPEHPSLPAALDAMKPVMDKAHPRSSLVSDLERMRINWEMWVEIYYLIVTHIYNAL